MSDLEKDLLQLHNAVLQATRDELIELIETLIRHTDDLRTQIGMMLRVIEGDVPDCFELDGDSVRQILESGSLATSELLLAVHSKKS